MFEQHIHDLFTEGLGDLFFMKYYNFLQRNIKNRGLLIFLVVLHAESLNSYDIFYHKKLVIFKNAISKICEIFSPKCLKINKVVA